MGRPAQASQMAYVRAGTSVHIRVYELLKSITAPLSASLLNGCFHRSFPPYLLVYLTGGGGRVYVRT